MVGVVGTDPPCQRPMFARQVVLLTPSESSRPKQLLSRQQYVPLSPLAATLMNSPVSVANKRLKLGLSSLDATLTKKWEGGGPLSTFQTVTLLDPKLTGHWPRNTIHGPRNTSHESPVTALPIPADTSAIMRKKLKTNYL